MKRFTSMLVMLLIGITAMAQTEATATKSNDPLDLSSQMEKVEKHGVPTVALVNELKTKAETLYSNQLWEDAAGAYEEYAQKANWLANLISQCVEPYYSASYDDRKNTSYSLIKGFIPYETKANQLKAERNVAYVKVGLCFKNMGETSKAVTYLHKGLELLSIDQISAWTEASNALAEIVGFTKE